MKESYLTSAFRETVHERFFAQEAELTAAFTKRLQELRRENAGATKEKQRHLEGQILPGIAAYETLQTVLPKEEALQTVHGYVERRAWRLKRIFLRLMRIPGLYRRVPGIFSRQTPKLFGKTAGFAAREIQTTGGVWRIDMTRCPYHDACVHYGCPELCPSFCDSDDITYDCTPGSAGAGQRRWGAAMTAATSACGFLRAEATAQSRRDSLFGRGAAPGGRYGCSNFFKKSGCAF